MSDTTARITCPGCQASFPVPTDQVDTFGCPVCAGVRPNSCGAPSDPETTDLLVTEQDRLVPSDHTVEEHNTDTRHTPDTDG